MGTGGKLPDSRKLGGGIPLPSRLRDGVAVVGSDSAPSALGGDRVPRGR